MSRRLAVLVLPALLAGVPAAEVLAAGGLGSATLRSQRQHAAGSAVRLEIDCGDLRATDVAIIKVSKPLGTERRGTILFFKGGTGTRFWSKFGSASRKAIRALRKSGFRTAQIRWKRGWLIGAPRANEGQAALGCRPATATRWVWEQLHEMGPDQAFCATGNSGGGAQVAYMLTHYGMADLLDAAVLTSGPPMGRIDLGCLRQGSRALWYSESAARLIDRGFGFRPGTGPCSTRDGSARDDLKRASLAAGRNDYVYPSTFVAFLFGERDSSSAVAQGLAYRDRLFRAGTPLLDTLLVAETPHALPSTAAGAAAVAGLLESECRQRR